MTLSCEKLQLVKYASTFALHFMDKIKVLLFADVMEEDYDGVSITLHHLIRRMPGELFELLVVTPIPPKNIEAFPYPVRVVRGLPVPGNNKYKLGIPFGSRMLRKELIDYKPDLVHYTTPSMMGIYAVRFARKFKLPVTTIYHSHFPAYIAYYFRFLPRPHKIIFPFARKLSWLYRSSNVVFAPGNTMKNFLREMNLPSEKIQILKRGVDKRKFDPALRDESIFDESVRKKHKILFVSRLVGEKETDTIIRVYRLLDQRRTDTQFIVVGDGQKRQEMEEEMPHAIFTGKVPNDQLGVYYASSDIFIFPSVTETFGNVVLEALASGLPVVAADEGGPRDIVSDGENGFLVTPKDEEAFYEKISELADNPQLRAHMSEKARAYALQQSWDAISKQFFATYQSLVNKD